MKIVILGPAFPLRGGIANFNETLAESLQKAGHEVIIFSYQLQYPNFLFPGKTQYAENESAPKKLNIINALNSINPFNWFTVAKKINAIQPYMVIARYWMPFFAPCLGTILKKINKTVKKVALVDNIIPHEKRLGDRTLTKYFTNQVDDFIVMSQSVASELKSFTNKNIVYTPHPIYNIYGQPVDKIEAINKLNLDKNKKYILFFGLIRAYKGLDLLIEALADETLTTYNLHLLVAGEFYESKEKYLDLINKFALKDKVTFFDKYIPNNDIKYYFSACDIVAQPYKSATQSGVTQIAYAMHKPMLVTNVGGLPEIVPNHKCGYVVDVNPKAIAAALLDFYKHNREEIMIANVIKEKERFTWEKFVEKIEALK